MVAGGREAVRSLQRLQFDLAHVLDAASEASSSSGKLCSLAGSGERSSDAIALFDGIVAGVKTVLESPPDILLGHISHIPLITQGE